MRDLPTFEELPLNPGGPPGNAWGLFGPNDELGMLNLLTPEVVRNAAREIREGVRFALDWTLDTPLVPTGGRKVFGHEIQHHTAPTIMNDDVVHFNTQSSTQWDGFRHYPYQKTQQFFQNSQQQDFLSTPKLGIDVWVRNGGIVGRGVLLDWARWAAQHDVAYDPFVSSPIRLTDLHAIIEEKGITFLPGDILFIRCGFVAKYKSLTTSQKQIFPDRSPGGFLGLEATKDSLKFIWDNRFAAVAGDSPGFERGSALGPYNDPDVTLHQWLLAGWGLPIGEMFNLEDIAEHCEKQQRWTFFLSSVPINVPGGVASPSNAVGIM